MTGNSRRIKATFRGKYTNINGSKGNLKNNRRQIEENEGKQLLEYDRKVKDNEKKKQRKEHKGKIMELTKQLMGNKGK
jgi:hypothetical protein